MTTLLPREGVTFCSNEHGAVLLDTTSGQFYGLNPTAALAWATLASGGDTEDAVARVFACFDIDEPTARRDVGDLLTLLLDRGLLEAMP